MHGRESRAPSVLVDLASPRLAVAVVGQQPPSDEEWADYVETTSALGDAHHRTVVFTAGGAPTVLQRAELERNTANHRDTRLAVIHVGGGTVARWHRSHDTRVFTPDELDDAFGFLELSARERTRVMLLARRLARELDVSGQLFGPRGSASATGSPLREGDRSSARKRDGLTVR